MEIDEITVGKTYILNGQYHFAKRVISFNREGRYPGGILIAKSVRPDGSMPRSNDEFSGKFFAEHAIKQID